MAKNKGDKRKHRKKSSQYSRIDAHRKIGKELVTPANAIGSLTTSSWRDDHAPEMLWAFLLCSAIPRDAYLDTFRRVAVWTRGTSIAGQGNPSEGGPHEITIAHSMPNVASEVDHTSLASLSDAHFKEFLAIATAHPLGYGALRPLMLIDSLPGVTRWQSELGVAPTDADWHTLADAVVRTFDHQSEASTDVRWLKLVVKMILGKLHFPITMRDRAEELLEFPNRGDLRSVRPFIRAGEMSFRRQPPSPWIATFWAEMLAKTKCVDPSEELEYSDPAVPVLGRKVILVARQEIASRFRHLLSSSRTDARIDAAFGFALYALSVLEEVAAPPISQLLLGRMGLRCLAEIVITFAYLLQKDQSQLWEAYRKHGTGQAKLAFLKLEQATGDVPTFVDAATLEELANEDVWQEFVNINVGHWATANLRDLAIASATKEIYDAYYDWTSTVSHAQWGAVRDSNFITCHNPLHRLHRIPRPYHRLMPTVVEDAIKLTNMALELLEQAYPAMDKLGRIGPARTPARPQPEASAEPPGDSSIR